MWESLRTLTSYQDSDGGNVLPLLNDENQPVFGLQEKGIILQTTFFSEQHLHHDRFNKDFKDSVEKELHEILNEKEHDDIYDSTAINKDITLEETQAASQYLKVGRKTLRN